MYLTVKSKNLRRSLSSVPFKVDLLEYAGESLRGLYHVWRVHQLGGSGGGQEALLR
jgi:hypothetical protein